MVKQENRTIAADHKLSQICAGDMLVDFGHEEAADTAVPGQSGPCWLVGVQVEGRGETGYNG
jgi:hypothetical protein